jgi:hypothetical protein
LAALWASPMKSRLRQVLIPAGLPRSILMRER